MAPLTPVTGIDGVNSKFNLRLGPISNYHFPDIAVSEPAKIGGEEVLVSKLGEEKGTILRKKKTHRQKENKNCPRRYEAILVRRFHGMSPFEFAVWQ